MRTLTARVAYERAATLERLRAAAPEAGLVIEGDVDATRDLDLTDLQGCELLILEQRDPAEALAPRLFSITSATPDVIVVVLVAAPRGGNDTVLLRAGAFDVLDDGPDLETNLAHVAAAARRVVSLQEERARLSSELSHQEKLSALGVLAAGVSHEINNPCAAILSNMHVVREQLEGLMARPRFHRAEALEQLSNEWLEAIGDTISAANRIESIVKTLNVFSRKSETLAPVITDINEEIRTVMRLIGKEVRFQADFSVNLNPLLPRMMSPPNSITQIITNLVVNALQALESSRSERPSVCIATDFDDDYLMLEVVDNGPGIPQDLLTRIFDPFFTTKPIGKGTGLGLSITQQLVEKLGGEIFAESYPGQGAKFRVVVQRTDTQQHAPGEMLQMPPATERLRVLLLDDDELILRSLQRSLSAHFECQVAAKARAALQLLDDDGDFDAVVSDVVMPEMNGLDFWVELGAHHPDLASRTVFISGGITSERLRVKVSDTGRPCLSKPLDMSELIKTIRRVGRPFEDIHR
jgi:signal transduction histidine kinase/CheY-like chemotaxis protein